MPQPLPVDVIPDWWDYAVDGVGVASGLATAGALIVAVGHTGGRYTTSRRLRCRRSMILTAAEDGGGGRVELENQGRRTDLPHQVLYEGSRRKLQALHASLDGSCLRQSTARDV